MAPKCSRKPLAYDPWSHLIFKHFDVISVICRRVYIPRKIVVHLKKKKYITFFLFTSPLIMNLRLESGEGVFPANNQILYAFVMDDRIKFGPTTAPLRETEVKRFESRCRCDFISFITVVISSHCKKNMPDAVSTGCKRCNAHSLPQQNLSYTHKTSTNYWSCRPHCSYVSWARHWTRDAWGTSKSRTFISFTNKFARCRWRLANCDTELFWIL